MCKHMFGALQIDYNPYLQVITDIAADTLRESLAAPPKLSKYITST